MKQTENNQNYKKESTPVVDNKPNGKSQFKAKPFMESDTLKCQKLEIVDQNGKCRMILTADADKSMILFMREKNPTIQIVASNGNPAQIDFIDVNGVPCLSLGLYDNGDSGLTIRDSKGRPRSITGYNHASDKMIRWDDESLK